MQGSSKANPFWETQQGEKKKSSQKVTNSELPTGCHERFPKGKNQKKTANIPYRGKNRKGESGGA